LTDTTEAASTGNEKEFYKAEEDLLDKTHEKNKSESPYGLSVYSAATVGTFGAGQQPGGMGGGGGAGALHGGGGGAAGPSTPSGAGSGAAMTAALQAGRVSALVDADGCHPDEYVLNQFTERDFQLASERFVHIQWRSVSEIFDYLGALLRYQARNKDTPLYLVWPKYPDKTIQDTPPKDQIANEQPSQQTSTSIAAPSPAPIIFAVFSNGSSDIRASYNGESVAPNDVDPKNPTADNTLWILSMLSTLVNYASQPSTISTSAPLRLLPIP
jgi:hypothetical protein